MIIIETLHLPKFFASRQHNEYNKTKICAESKSNSFTNLFHKHFHQSIPNHNFPNQINCKALFSEINQFYLKKSSLI